MKRMSVLSVEINPLQVKVIKITSSCMNWGWYLHLYEEKWVRIDLINKRWTVIYLIYIKAEVGCYLKRTWVTGTTTWAYMHECTGRHIYPCRHLWTCPNSCACIHVHTHSHMCPGSPNITMEMINDIFMMAKSESLIQLFMYFVVCS